MAIDYNAKMVVVAELLVDLDQVLNSGQVRASLQGTGNNLSTTSSSSDGI